MNKENALESYGIGGRAIAYGKKCAMVLQPHLGLAQLLPPRQHQVLVLSVPSQPLGPSGMGGMGGMGGIGGMGGGQQNMQQMMQQMQQMQGMGGMQTCTNAAADDAGS